MAADISGVLQTTVTRTASLNGAAFGIPTGTPKRGLIARFSIASFVSATAGTIFTPSIEHSDDGTAFTSCAVGQPLTGATAANTTQSPIFVRFFTKKPFIRACMTISGGGGPSIVYKTELVQADQ